ncbi:hypothetical protein [Longimicrobium terrae]|uniref:Uncharacterized protein n=1 Tax=Longimicrobium terrae TaxID=1639882 RepID=A0A841H4B9_9BACT|nr:hypothetical protein [Longimicrobium terrae]MBB4638732.1 hypothetical protein [Longimicrobium terrae]MBB6072971.1 hypothetical protein [Longimicrobium terrae]NNC33096.1 hypothetical protein [Longimicrobium terrae]
MYRIQARPWAEVEALFLAIRPGPHHFAEMAALVRLIAARYEGRLFASASMHALLIANVAEWDPDHDVLRIDLEGERIRFAHHSMPGRPPTWVRHAEGDARAAFDLLERFVSAHWLIHLPFRLTPDFESPLAGDGPPECRARASLEKTGFTQSQQSQRRSSLLTPLTLCDSIPFIR